MSLTVGSFGVEAQEKSGDSRHERNAQVPLCPSLVLVIEEILHTSLSLPVSI